MHLSIVKSMPIGSRSRFILSNAGKLIRRSPPQDIDSRFPGVYACINRNILGEEAPFPSP